MDQFLTTCVIFWSTNSITSSMRFYYETLKQTPFAQQVHAQKVGQNNVQLGGDIRSGSTFVAVPSMFEYSLLLAIESP